MIAKNKRIKNVARQTTFFSALLGVLLFTVVGYLVVSNLKINSRRAELQSQLIKLETELNDLEAKKAQLQAQVSEVASDEYLDEKANEQGYKKPGEEVLVIVPAENNQAPQEEENFLQKIIDKIKFW